MTAMEAASRKIKIEKKREKKKLKTIETALDRNFFTAT
jgi:hypothetical protein